MNTSKSRKRCVESACQKFGLGPQDVTTDATGMFLSTGAILLDSQFSVITEVVFVRKKLGN